MKAQHGHSLIELMIAMALGLMIVSSLLVVYANTVPCKVPIGMTSTPFA